MIMGKQLGRLAGLVALGLFGLTTGCPIDPRCPDCHLKARSATCGELALTGKVPEGSPKYTAPKLSVIPTSGSEELLALASAANPEPWLAGGSFDVTIEPGELPTLCDDVSEEKPHGRWHAASLRLVLVDASGKTKTFKVENDLPPAN